MFNGMPPPMTDPLQMAGANSEDLASHKIAEDGFKKQHDSISRGMPARNFKTWGIIATGLVAAVYLYWPSSNSKEQKPVELVVKDTAPGAAIVAALKGNSQPQVQAPALVLESPTPKLGLSAIGGQAGPLGIPSTGTSDNSDTRDSPLKRQNDITASSMEASEVKISRTGNGDRINQNANSEASSVMKDALSKQSSLIEKMFDGDRKGGVTHVDKLSAQDDFLFRASTKGVESAGQMTSAIGPASLYQGTIVRVVLDRSLNTDTPGAIRGRVTSDIYDSLTQKILIIPRGSIVVGSYMNSLLIGQARILIALERLILPNGKSISLLGTPAADMQGASGVEAKVDDHFWDMFKTSIVLGAASLILPKDQQSISVSDSAQGTSRTAGSIIGSSIYDTIKRVTERNGVIKPTGTIDLGEPFTLMLSRDVQMEPYQR